LRTIAAISAARSSGTFAASRCTTTWLTLASALASWSLGRTIALRLALGTRCFWRLGFRARSRFSFRSAWFLLCLLDISHPNLFYWSVGMSVDAARKSACATVLVIRWTLGREPCPF
jgi:hypothetical protein